MFARITAAAVRGIFVALLIALPSLILPAKATQMPEILVFLALLGGLLTFAEYFSIFPSFVEFRNAPPLNRMRYIALLMIIASLSLFLKHPDSPNGLSALAQGLGTNLGEILDFPYSPVQLMVLMLPDTASPLLVETIRSAAGLAYIISVVSIIFFILAIRILNWPIQKKAFNVWVNLPLFDPTTGGDVVSRLHRDAQINVALGCLLPFAVPGLIKLASDLIAADSFASPHTVIWIVGLWAFVPASITMRGLAMMRIADLIELERKRTYALSDTLQTV